MKCPNCKEDRIIRFTLFVRCPAKYAHLITKEVIRKKEFKILGAGWDKATITCPNCGYFEHGI